MLRFAPRAAALLVSLAFVPQAAAQDRAASIEAVSIEAAPEAQRAAGPDSKPAFFPPALKPSRGPLVPLYASFATLQILDLHSTRSALSRGGVEANPVVSGAVGNTFALAAIKAAGTAGVIAAAEKLRTRHKAAAIGLMIAANSGMAWVVQHNYRVGR